MIPIHSLGARAVLLSALVTCGAHSLPAQQAPKPSQSEQTPASTGLVLKSVVRRVVLDVVVTDSQGKPVRGLSQQDFSLAEDGKPQRILSFDTYNFDSPAEAFPTPVLPANTFVNVPHIPERGPLYVLLYDMLNTTTDDQMFAHQQLVKFVNSKPQGSRFALFVLADGLRLIQGFTADSTELLAALNRHSQGARIPKIFLYGDNYGKGNVQYMVEVLTMIAHFLEGLPGRKNLIWVSGSFPSSLLPGVESSTDEFSYGGNPAAGEDYSSEIKEATDALARGQIAVYTVDLRGVAVDANAGGQHQALNASYITERSIAEATGGHAFISDNHVADALNDATDTGANYYTLSYSPTNQDYDGRLRKIHVDLARHGYHLAYRRSYFSDKTRSPARMVTASPAVLDNAPQPAASDSLFANMLHGAPLAHEIVFKAHIHTVGSPTRATPQQMADLGEQPAYFRERHKHHADKPLAPIEVADLCRRLHDGGPSAEAIAARHAPAQAGNRNRGLRRRRNYAERSCAGHLPKQFSLDTIDRRDCLRRTDPARNLPHATADHRSPERGVNPHRGPGHFD
jgi:VWFA-related protein